MCTRISLLQTMLTTDYYYQPSLLCCHLCAVGKYHKVLVAFGSNNPVGKKVDYYPAFNLTLHPGVTHRC